MRIAVHRRVGKPLLGGGLVRPGRPPGHPEQPPGRDVVQRQRRAGCLDGSAATTCNHGNSHLRRHRRTDRVVTVRQESRARRNGIRPADKWMAPLRRMNPRHCQQPGGGRLPIRTYVRRPTRPPLLYFPAVLDFPAVLAVRVFRISFLTSGAKRARTADLLHAIPGDFVCPDPRKSGTRRSGHMRCLAGSGAGRKGLGA